MLRASNLDPGSQKAIYEGVCPEHTARFLRDGGRFVQESLNTPDLRTVPEGLLRSVNEPRLSQPATTAPDVATTSENTHTSIVTNRLPSLTDLHAVQTPVNSPSKTDSMN